MIAMIAFFGYLFGISHAYGWGHLTHMAVLTAIGFMVFGMGIIAFAWKDDKGDGMPRWLPLLVLVGTTTATVVLWQAFAVEEQAQIGRTVKQETAVLAFGLVLAVLLALAVHLAQTARQRAREKP